MSRNILERNNLFGATTLEFHRLALNMNQVEEFSPPPNPTKLTDSRASSYIKDFGYSCWELDALEPRVITELIRQNVEAYRDEKLYRAVKQREDEEKELLHEAARHWEDVANNWEEVKERFVFQS